MRVIQVWRSRIGTATPADRTTSLPAVQSCSLNYHVFRAVSKALSKDCMTWMRRSKIGGGQHLDEESSMPNDQPFT